ncbi:ABC transporter ATP-binding protein [Anaerostipes butyraticus]|uniref:Sugar ABC transporter ATP-binding protein n=1 Tax=Anaerostipes butyraticus TaxID=645466 RepID=A0A916VDJ3_9FIRM|nr:ABC transporter ATP-binding protein [Anaerostipes butyraticus]GFO85283.1 sugar ABC transporter ATP-binding protein [Anaerostipes butyraticus]HJC82559.1 ABC transporter ATP-binding protein/permease [Candidatus Anaerostipes avicola]
MRGKKGNKEVLKRILLCIRPYTSLVVLSLGLAVITVGLTLYVPILTGNAVDYIAGKGSVDFGMLGKLIVLIIAAITVTAAAQWLMNHVNNMITYRIVQDLRVQAFHHLHRVPAAYVDSHPAGDLISRIITDVEQFSDGLLMGFTQLFTGVLTIAGTIVFMLTIHPLITLVVVVLSPLSFGIAGFISKNTFQMFKKQSETRGELTSLTDEMLGNLKVVEAFGYQEKAQERFEEINERLAGYSLRATFFSSLTNPATRIMYSIIYAGVTLAGCFTVIAGGLTVGRLTSFLSYTNQYTKPFNEITGVITEFQNSLASAARVFRFLDEEPETEDSPDAEELTEIQGKVELEDVAFSYRPDQRFMEHLNLSAQPGQRIAIVGPTGCGKTTLINLLMRFYDVTDGNIYVDGHEIRDITRKSLRSNFGMVLQETWLKNTTIRENIAYGKPDAADEEIIRAAKEAHAHNFIMKLPQQYDTVLGEDGGSLSQGQKQLLCIARVMLDLPPMLILDEATSSIDTMTEIRIQNAFGKMMNGRTSFIVAHRLSTIREADVILVMKDGKIIEKGTHKELLKQNGFYAELYQSQFAPS